MDVWINAWAVDNNKCYTLSNCETSPGGQPSMILYDGAEPLPYVRIANTKCGRTPTTTQSATPKTCHQAAVQQGAAMFNYDGTACELYTSEFCSINSALGWGSKVPDGTTNGYYLTSYPPKHATDICYGFPILMPPNEQSVPDCMTQCNNHEWCAHVVFITEKNGDVGYCLLYTEDQCTRAIRAGVWLIADLQDATYERYPRNWTDKSGLSAGTWVAIVTAIVAVVAIGATYAWAREAPAALAEQFLMF